MLLIGNSIFVTKSQGTLEGVRLEGTSYGCSCLQIWALFRDATLKNQNPVDCQVYLLGPKKALSIKNSATPIQPQKCTKYFKNFPKNAKNQARIQEIW